MSGRCGGTRSCRKTRCSCPAFTSTSNYVEHPELVAQRIQQFADIVGRDRVIAGTDCGFGTFAGIGKMDAGISWRKLAALVEGAAARERASLETYTRQPECRCRRERTSHPRQPVAMRVDRPDL